MNPQGDRWGQQVLKKKKKTRKVRSLEKATKKKKGTRWGNRRDQSRGRDTRWYQRQKEQIHGRGRQYHQTPVSSYKHRSNRWIGGYLHLWQTWHHWQDEYERNPRSRRKAKKMRRQHYRKQHFQRTTSSNLRSSWCQTEIWSNPLLNDLKWHSIRRCWNIRTESKVKSLGGEVTNDIGSICSP